MALYLARYLNVPSASLPGERGDSLNDLPVAAKEICAALLDAFDRQRQIDAAARLVARFLTLGHPPETLIATLAQALSGRMLGFMPTRCSGPGYGSFTSGATATRAVISLLPSRGIWLPIFRPSARCCRRPT